LTVNLTDVTLRTARMHLAHRQSIVIVVGTSKQKHRCLPTSMFKKFGIDGRYIVRETSIFHKHRYFGLWYGTKTRSSLNKCVIFPNDKKSNKNKMRNSVNN
jgi:hypothetical protein